MSGLANPNEEKENTGGAAASTSTSTSNDSAPKEKKGGLGRDKASRKFANATAEEIEAANSDGKFGYYDMTNKRYVPAFFDMFDGGGQDTRGDTFKGGPLSNLLNKIGVDPYGSQRERMFVAPNTSSAIQAAVQGGGGSGGGGVRPVLRPDNLLTEAQKEQVVMNQPVGNGYPDMSMPAIAGYTIPKPAGADYPNMNMPAIAGYTALFTDQMTRPQGTLDQIFTNENNLDGMRLNTTTQGSDGAPLMPPPVGMTPSMSGGSYMVAPSQEFAPQGQFSSTAPSITQLGTSDFEVVDYLEKNNIPVTMQNVTKYRQILGG